MKKQLFLLVTFATMCQVQALSKNDIDRQLAVAINNVSMEALEPSSSLARQQQVVTLWENSMEKARQFINDNNKDLLKKVDPILVNNLLKINDLNNDFINTIKVIRGTLANAPISRLLQVSTNAKNLITQFQQQSFTLSGKKDALFILIRIAQLISQSSKSLYDSLVARK